MPVCPFCYSRKLRRFGIYRYGGQARQKWMCERCGGVSAYPLSRMPKRRPRRLR